MVLHFDDCTIEIERRELTRGDFLCRLLSLEVHFDLAYSHAPVEKTDHAIDQVDVVLTVETMTARFADRLEEAVAPLPGPERDRVNASQLGYRADRVEARVDHIG